MTEPIIVIGAGISGLALGQGLRKHSIPFRIFGRDERLDSRAQGYRFRLSDQGVQTLEESLDARQYQRFLDCCCTRDAPESNVPSLIVDALTGEVAKPLFQQGARAPVGGDTVILSVDRSAARRVLLEGIEHHVQFGRGFKSFEEHDSIINVTFNDGSIAQGCALVGADGVSSRIGRYEARLIFGKAELRGEVERVFSSPARSGLRLIRASQQNCLVETMRFNPEQPQVPLDYVYWVLFMRKDQYLPDHELLSLEPSGIFRLAQRFSGDWHDDFKLLFTSGHAHASVLRILTEKPGTIPLALDEGSRVTLIGDAGHAMAPTAALGATTALADVGILVGRLLEHGGLGRCTAAFRAYESTMKEHAAAALEKSLLGGRAVFGMKPFAELPMVEV
ncbi:hypothetical protein M409DRAFT_48553 [Zasmidium cellare ATCC 36951]|uniref:Uncharacterized protein n=1 Tax=Zasmidium cellare ATCC 36951 TaxID=1080233 RepID=A0A6A6D5B1_ZASCE|nr:uncharacterized protein M409DRAFT_48553 [Zasmidium cellare ATCC 36951]KAF2173598.1 hypothetical protein M409DRAFT_48553 [Zasmidium cellare ATCC 36951]